MLWLMRHPIPTESVRYNDNRVSLYAGQDGQCAITGKKLDVQTCICYRKTNNRKKGNDSYQNLLLLSLQGLAIVSAEDMMSCLLYTSPAPPFSCAGCLRAQYDRIHEK